MLDMDMPSIATNKKVEVEICTNPPDNGDQDSLVPGKTSLAIGNSSVIAIGDHSQVVWWQDEKEWLDVGGNQVKYPPSFHSGLMIMFQYERVRYDFNYVNSNQSDGVGNRINIDYDVIFSNIQNNIYEDGKYYVSSGVAVYNSEDEVFHSLDAIAVLFIFLFLD